MSVAADEVDRPVEELLPPEHVPDWPPPLPGGSGVADLGAAQELDAQVHGPVPDSGDEVPHPGAEQHRQPGPVVLFDLEQRGRLGQERLRIQIGGLTEPGMGLVPLDLGRDQDRDQVVEIRAAGECDRQGPAGAVPPPATAAGGGHHRPPVGGLGAASPKKPVGVLAQADVLKLKHHRRQTMEGVEEGSAVEPLLCPQGVQRGLHLQVGALQHLEADLPRRAQHRPVGADIEPYPLLARHSVASARRLSGHGRPGRGLARHRVTGGGGSGRPSAPGSRREGRCGWGAGAASAP